MPMHQTDYSAKLTIFLLFTKNILKNRTAYGLGGCDITTASRRGPPLLYRLELTETN